MQNDRINEVGSKVSAFYNKTPFPDYDLSRFNVKGDLISSAYPFARVLDRSIPESASVVDVGTGTGQLSAFLSLRRRCVYGLDFSDGSLSKAKKLKEKLRLDTLTLKKLDVLDENQVDEIDLKFDYVLCLGVLHHTGDPYRGFCNMLKLLKPGGYVAVGLYNKYGRIPLKTRQLLAKTIFKNSQAVKDRFIRMQIGDVEDKERARGWWNQYLHPHESTHTVGEVLNWFNKNKIEYMQSVPTLNLFDSTLLDIRGVWSHSESYPRLPVRAYKQLAWIHKTNREGGYWIMFGRKIK